MDEENLPATQPVDNRVLKDVVAFVDVRTEHDNRSKCVEHQLEMLGATISKGLKKNVTHVIFKDGGQGTYRKAKKMDVHFLSVLWVASCKEHQSHVAESLFPANVSEAYDGPIRLRKMKSMQPTEVEEDLAKSAALIKRRERAAFRKEVWNMFCTPGKLKELEPFKAADLKALNTPPITFNPRPLKPVKWIDASSDDDSSDEKVLPLIRRLYKKFPDSPELEEYLKTSGQYHYRRRGLSNPETVLTSKTEPDCDVTPLSYGTRSKSNSGATNSPNLGSSALLCNVTPKRKRKAGAKVENDDVFVLRVAELRLQNGGGVTSSSLESERLFGQTEKILGVGEEQPIAKKVAVAAEEEAPSLQFSEFYRNSAKNCSQNGTHRTALQRGALPVEGNVSFGVKNCSKAAEAEELWPVFSEERGPRSRNGTRKSTPRSVSSVRQRKRADSSGAACPGFSDGCRPRNGSSVPKCPPRRLTNWSDVSTSSVVDRSSGSFVADNGHNGVLNSSGSASESQCPIGANEERALKTTDVESPGFTSKHNSPAAFKSQRPIRANSGRALRTTGVESSGSISKHNSPAAFKLQRPIRANSGRALRTTGMESPGSTSEHNSPASLKSQRPVRANSGRAFRTTGVESPGSTSEDNSPAVFQSQRPVRANSGRALRTTGVESPGSTAEHNSSASLKSQRPIRANSGRALRTTGVESPGSASEHNSPATLKLQRPIRANSGRALRTTFAESPSADVTIEADDETLGPSLEREQSVSEDAEERARMDLDGTISPRSDERGTAVVEEEPPRTMPFVRTLEDELKSRNSLDDFKGIFPRKTRTVVPRGEIGKRPSTPTGQGVSTVLPVFSPKHLTKHIALTSFDVSEKETLVPIIKTLKGCRLSYSVDRSTTHLVTGSPRRTLNTLLATVRGYWILGREWVYDSLEAGDWLDETKYELAEHFPAAKFFRMEKGTNFHNYACSLFCDVGPIFISSTTNMPANQLKDLLKLAGANVVKGDKKARISIGRASSATSATCVTELWVFDCITKHSILPLEEYSVPGIEK